MGEEWYGDLFIDPSSELKFGSGEIVDVYDTHMQRQIVSDGGQEYIEIRDLTGETKVTLVPNDGKKFVKFDQNGKPIDFNLEFEDDGYTYDFQSDGGMRIYEEGVEGPILSFDYNDGEIYNAITDDATNGLLFQLADKLLEIRSPYYALYNKVAEHYNYFASKYNEFKANEKQIAYDVFNENYTQTQLYWDDEVSHADKLWLAEQINDEEYAVMLEQIDLQYRPVMEEIMRDYTDMIADIERRYYFELDELPTLGGDDE